MKNYLPMKYNVVIDLFFQILPYEMFGIEPDWNLVKGGGKKKFISRKKGI